LFLALAWFLRRSVWIEAAMAKQKSARSRWVYSPKAAPKPKVPDEIKLEVSQLAQEIIDE
jgi:hypothetical protein